nr:protein FAR1-RELATED SEQUENCE 5-like [Quercus suber]
MGIHVPSNVPMESTPFKGMEFEADEIAYGFYNEYGKKAGFSTRKEYINKCKKTGVVTSRRFVCAKEGVRGKDKRDQNVKNPRAETRCGCEARLVIVLNRDSKKYVVSEFIAEHNHYLHLPSTVHMMPSQRKVAATHAIEFDLAHESGLRLKQSFYEFLSKQVGGYDTLGFTKQDHKNYLRTKRQRDMEHGATASLGRYFSHQPKKNPSYYFPTQLDCEELITNIFWADARIIIDYSHFGDVITFDTTYSTNRDARPLGVFLGLNHHRETVVFGGALLYDETIESFVWLFETFLEAMSEKKPITIFTDQDAAMSAAIKVVMPETYHALCSWHMWQNAEKHLGHLLKNEPQFNTDFLACIYEYDSEDEFLTAWNEMLDKYDVRENKWLIDLFKLKEKWAQAYVKRTFTAGMKTTQLSESFNADLKDCLRTDFNIVEFFTHFETVVNQKRDKELEAEYNCRQKFPRLKLKSSPMLNQVATVYTPKLFDLFQTEVEEVMALSILERNVSQTHSYVVGVFNQNGKFEVMWNPLDETLSCSCRKFESFGILCRHGLKVLDALDIKLIPNRYIMKRNCKANVEEDIIRPSTDFADKEDQLCASITIVPKGIKKREVYRNKKRRTKSWIEKMRKPKEGTSKKQTKKRKVQEEIYARDIMAQKKTEDISSGNTASLTQLLMSAFTSSAVHQEGSSASVALTSHLESTSSVVGSNDKINGVGGIMTQGSVASGGPLTQESITSGWNPMVHKVKPFF